MDLVRELEAEMQKFQYLAMLVGFEGHSEVIFGGDDPKENLDQLNAFLEKGGTPLGMVGAVSTESDLTIYTRPLAEFADDVSVHAFLNEFVEVFYRRLVSTGVIPAHTRLEKGTGWIN
jgi:hypothetical protein